MSIDETKQVLEAYWQDHDPRHVAENAVFTMQPTGEEIRGRDAIAKHLAGFYHGALEARVQGRHTGVFAGVPATGREVDVPLCVTYDVSGGKIQHARIYLLVNVLLAQITSG